METFDKKQHQRSDNQSYVNNPPTNMGQTEIESGYSEELDNAVRAELGLPLYDGSNWEMEYLDNLIKRASQSWKDVKDVDKWLAHIHGYEEEDSKEGVTDSSLF